MKFRVGKARPPAGDGRRFSEQAIAPDRLLVPPPPDSSLPAPDPSRPSLARLVLRLIGEGGSAPLR